MRHSIFKIMLCAALSMGSFATVSASVATGLYQEKQYKKIDLAEVSKDALSKIKKNYGDYTIKEAYRADDGEYKLILVKEGTELTATFTPAGDLIKIY